MRTLKDLTQDERIKIASIVPT